MSDSTLNRKTIDGVVVLSEFDVANLSNPPADKIYLYAEDNGSGTTIIKIKDSTGATKDVAITLSSPLFSAVNLSTSATPIAQEGQIRWNDADKCAEVVQDKGVILQVGQEITVRARNVSGEDLLNGTPVYVNGATGFRPRVEKANANNILTAETLIGLVTDSDGIADNADGHVTVFGLVRDLDTSDYEEGDILYLAAGTAGQLTATKPSTEGQFVVRVGYVTKSHVVQGVILVSPQYMGSVTGDSLVSSVGKAAARAAIGAASASSLSADNSEGATSLGSLSKKVEIFDSDGNSLGFVPIYSTIT